VADPAAGLGRLKRIALARAQPLFALLELTYACSWRCVFCCNPRHHDRRGLGAAEWIAVLDELRHLGTLSVTLSGGDALAHPAFLEIAGGVRERGLALRIFTNGSLLDEALADRIAALTPLSVELSLHGGRASTHDRTTGRRGSFSALLRGLDLLRARAVPLLLKTPLTRLNEGELFLMETLAAERGVPWKVDATLTARDDGDPLPLRSSATSAGVERLFRLLARRGRLPDVERRPGEPNCGLGLTALAVDPEGNVFPCVQWRAAPIGNVRTARLREVWAASPVRQQAARASAAANQALLGGGAALARFPFCPALALERCGDPTRADEDHLHRAALADRLRAASA